jgi:hypothetical protein
LFKSDNAGATVSEVVVDSLLGAREFQCLVKRGNNIMCATVVSGVVNIYSSTNGGATFAPFVTIANNLGLGIGWTSPDFQQRYALIGGRFVTTLNSGSLWSDLGVSLSQAMTYMSFCELSPLRVYGIHTATAGGNTIVRVNTAGGLPTTNLATITGFVGSYIASSPTGNKVIVSGQGRSFLSTDFGLTFTEMTSELPAIVSPNAYRFQLS